MNEINPYASSYGEIEQTRIQKLANRNYGEYIGFTLGYGVVLLVFTIVCLLVGVLKVMVENPLSFCFVTVVGLFATGYGIRQCWLIRWARNEIRRESEAGIQHEV